MMKDNKTIKTCNHTKENYSLYLTAPLNSLVPNFNSIVDYYQYHAPQIDCVHSVGEISDIETQQRVFNELVKIAKMQNRYNFIERFQPNSLALFQLEGTEICIKCPRMICKTKKGETELSSLLRHLRNVFAHGRTYIKKTKNQTYIVLEDYDQGRKPKLTAKFVVTKTILEKWKLHLEKMFC